MLVRLSEHRCAGLLQDVVAGELSALVGDIDIDDTAVCGFEVSFVHCEHVASEGQPGLLGTVVGTDGCQVLDG